MLYYLISIAIAFSFLAVGCGGGSAPSSVSQKGKASSIEKRKTESSKTGEQKGSEKKEEKEYVYDPVGKTDPFKPFIQITSVRESTRNVPLTPLQKYEISQ